MTLRVAVAQTAPALGAVDANLEEIARIAADLRGNAQIVVFPELFTTGYGREGLDHEALAEPVPGPSTWRLGEIARSSGLTIVGTILERADGEIFDTAVVVEPEGGLTGTYRKTHLYPAERMHFSQGHELRVVDAGGARIGLAICFEHAFPEIFAELALAGAELVAIPSAVPVNYEYLLRLRTRARAQDNQVYVAAANLVGADGANVWCGRSMIVDPRGEILAELGGSQPDVVAAELDLGRIATERAQEPLFANRRPELYPRLAGRSAGVDSAATGDRPAAGDRAED